MTKIFSYDEGQVLVTSTIEALGDQPFLCEVQHRGFPTKAYMVEATYPLNAAQEALDNFKAEHKLNPTTAWSL